MIKPNRNRSMWTTSKLKFISALLVAGYGVIFIMLLMMSRHGTSESKVASTLRISIMPVTPRPARHNQSEIYCNSYMAHAKGRWDHSNNNHTLDQSAYFPEEIGWIQGKNVPSSFGSCKQGNDACCSSIRKDETSLMYSTGIGDHCGCGMAGFKPSDSLWLPSSNSKQSASIELMQRLMKSNSTLCFAGDSIDYQLYTALGSNLRRHAIKLHPERNLSISTDKIPVTYSTKPRGGGYWFLIGSRPPDSFRVMSSILEMTASYEGSNNFAKFRYFKMYGWSPWVLEHMHNDRCDLLIMNLGLHYNTTEESIIGMQNFSPLIDDVRAAITFLTNFTSDQDNSNRVAVWRSALPQHFNTPLGHYMSHYPGKNNGCRDIIQSSRGEGALRQRYNAVYDKAFQEMCENKQKSSSCDHLEYNCSVNITTTEFQTLYKFWKDNPECSKELESIDGTRRQKHNTTGRILNWDIWDLFDVPQWHTRDHDCTHFCYVPSLYEAAFERLNLIFSLFS